MPETTAAVDSLEAAPVRPVPPPTPTPTSQAREWETHREDTPRVWVIHTRDLPGTACAPEDESQYEPWLFREIVQWTPDGSTVLFTNGSHIYAVATDGSRLRNVVVPAPAEGKRVGPMAPFTISPDGEHVVYATCDYHRFYELARVPNGGTQAQRLTNNEERFDSFPRVVA